MPAFAFARFALHLTFLLALLTVPALANDWPSFRGPQASGVADGPVPTSWDVEKGENIRWRTEIPGLGFSSPAIHGDRLYVTTAIAEAGEADLKVGLYGDIAAADDDGTQSWRLYCLDKNTGKVLWQRTSKSAPPLTKRHTKSSHANPTPAVDADRVLAFFGSEGLYAYNHDGELLWSKDFGRLRSSFFALPSAEWGFASSPVLHDGKVVIQVDVIGESFLTLLDAKDGSEIWRTARKDFPTWSTPTVATIDGRELVLVNGFKHMGAYDFKTGEALWHLAGGGDIPVPTPVVAHGLVYLTNAHGAKAPVYAIHPASGKGDISLADDASSSEHIAWSVERGGAYMQTPLVYGDELYVCRDNGVLSVFDAKTGERHYQERLGSGTGFTASAVAADGKIYFTSEEGDVHVLKAGKSFEKLGVNALGEVAMASPAISDETLYFRTRHHVVAVAEQEAKPKETTEAGR